MKMVRIQKIYTNICFYLRDDCTDFEISQIVIFFL